MSFRVKRVLTLAAAIGTNSLTASATDFVSLQPVVIVGSQIVDSDFWSFPFVSSFDVVAQPTNPFGMHGAQMVQYINTQHVIYLTNMCTTPGLADDHKVIGSESPVYNRWLAATAVYAIVQQNNMISTMNEMNAGIKVIMNGITYKGFRVQYTDGVQEVWAITLNANFSAVKLMDQPMPNSKKAVSAGCR